MFGFLEIYLAIQMADICFMGYEVDPIRCVLSIPRKFTIPGEVSELVLEFQEDSRIHGLPVLVDRPVFMTNYTNETLAGQCVTIEDKPIQITFSDDIWSYLSDRQRHILVWHELGHCFYRLDHTPDRFDLMNPDVGEVLGTWPQLNATFWRSIWAK